MIDHLPSIAAFNVMVNSWLAFFTVSLLCKLVVFIFRVKEPRVKAFIFCIPVLKLVLDLALYYDHSNWALFHSIDPRFAEDNSRKLSVYIGFFPWLIPGIQFSIGDDKLFTVADVLALYLGPFWTKSIVTLTFGCSIVALTRWILKLGAANCAVKALVNDSIPISKQIAISDRITSPCAVGLFKRRILFPKNLVRQLSSEEMEAILVHEKNHLFWHDSLVRLLCQGFTTFFWWIPTKRWLASIENLQESACDKKCKNRLDLAEAIVKVAKFEKMTTQQAMMSCFVANSNITKRVQTLLKNQKEQVRPLKWLQIVLAAITAFSLLLGHFWLF